MIASRWRFAPQKKKPHVINMFPLTSLSDGRWKPLRILAAGCATYEHKLNSLLFAFHLELGHDPKIVRAYMDSVISVCTDQGNLSVANTVWAAAYVKIIRARFVVVGVSMI